MASVVSPARGKLWDKYNNLRKEIRKTNQQLNKEITPENLFIPSEGTVINSIQIFQYHNDMY